MKMTIDGTTITGTGKMKPILSFYQLPKKYQKIMVDIYHGGYSSDTQKVLEYLDECFFFTYRNYVYNLSDMMKLDSNSILSKYADAYESETYFSGILVKLYDDYVKCYSYYS